MLEQVLQPLTAQQVALLKETFRLVDTDRLAMRFYTSLFAKYPEVKALFPSDLSVLSTKIVSVFELVVHSFKENSKGEFHLQQEVLRPLRALGELHSQKGVINDYYPWVNALLLESIRIEASTNFTNEMEVAWKLALNNLTIAMLSNIQISADEQHVTMKDSFAHIKSLLFQV
jgi:hemoglobin-like flavoprotein